MDDIRVHDLGRHGASIVAAQRDWHEYRLVEAVDDGRLRCCDGHGLLEVGAALRSLQKLHREEVGELAHERQQQPLVLIVDLRGLRARVRMGGRGRRAARRPGADGAG